MAYRERISSSLTFFQRFLVPAGWSGAFLAFAVLGAGAAGVGLAELLLLWLCGLGAFIWFSLRLRSVWLEGDHLVVRNVRHEFRVPLALVREVSETRVWNPKMIKLQLESRPNLPEQVVFMAPAMIQAPFTDHFMVTRLRRLVEQARRRG